MNNDRQARREAYFKLSSAIAYLDNEQLRAHFAESETEPGWGRNHTITVDDARVFVKRVPVTDLEYANLFSTRNLYDLPSYYNYGVGSAGFGVFRELVTHIKTTNWVLAGAIETFPLLYHYRIIPATGQPAGVSSEEQQRYVAYWNNNQNIGHYMLDRAKATHELILCLEYIPYVLEPWLGDHLDQLPTMIAAMQATTAFLRQNGILHFDTHFYNILTDGQRPYLTDFGLTLDRQFALSDAEQRFLTDHRYYDDGEFLSGVGHHLMALYRQMADDDKQRLRQVYGLADDVKHHELLRLLLNKIEEIQQTALLPIEPYYVEILIKYRTITLLMLDFHVAMRQNHCKDTPFQHATLQQLLQEAGYIANKLEP